MMLFFYASPINNLTREELAETVEISSNYLSKVERGLSIPGADLLLSIAEKTGLTMQDFGIFHVELENQNKVLLDKMLLNCDNSTYKLILAIVKTVITETKNSK